MSTDQAIRHQNATERSTGNLEGAIERIRRASGSIGTQVFLARVLNAVASITKELDERSLAAVAGAPSDYDVLLQILEEPEALARLEDPLGRARLRGLRMREQLLATEGGTISATEAANLLHISRQAVDKRRRVGHLIGLSIGRRGYAYPIWQFSDDGETLAGLADVLTLLSEHDPWMQTEFMLNPNALLGDMAPLELLRQGETERVARAARLFGEQSAA